MPHNKTVETVNAVVFKHSLVAYAVTLFILMDFPIHIDTISMDLSFLYFKGSQVEISKI